MIQGPGSRILDAEPRILNTGSRAQDTGSRIQDPGSWILDPESCMVDPGSWILGPGYRILDPGPHWLSSGYWGYPGDSQWGPGPMGFPFIGPTCALTIRALTHGTSTNEYRVNIYLTTAGMVRSHQKQQNTCQHQHMCYSQSRKAKHVELSTQSQWGPGSWIQDPES